MAEMALSGGEGVGHGSATYGPRVGSGPPSKITRPAAPLQIVVIVWLA